ncbi:MAG: hypothetical protein WBM78_24690 [Desulfobacterales bacterium]
MLEAWLHVVRQNFAGVAAWVKKIETVNAATRPDTPGNITHVQGQFETLKALVHYLTADGESALALSQRALEDIPRHHIRARLFADLHQLGAYQMVGKLETGLSIYQEAMDRNINRDRNYHAMYLANLGLVYWVDANLTALHQTAECLLDLIRENPPPAAVSFGLYFLGLVQYHRNELQIVEEKLMKVVETYKAAGPMNYAHGAFALALTYQAQGKQNQAREISRSVVIDAIESNNSNG